MAEQKVDTVTYGDKYTILAPSSITGFDQALSDDYWKDQNETIYKSLQEITATHNLSLYLYHRPKYKIEVSSEKPKDFNANGYYYFYDDFESETTDDESDQQNFEPTHQYLTGYVYDGDIIQLGYNEDYSKLESSSSRTAKYAKFKHFEIKDENNRWKKDETLQLTSMINLKKDTSYNAVFEEVTATRLKYYQDNDKIKANNESIKNLSFDVEGAVGDTWTITVDSVTIDGITNTNNTKFNYGLELTSGTIEKDETLTSYVWINGNLNQDIYGNLSCPYTIKITTQTS